MAAQMEALAALVAVLGDSQAPLDPAVRAAIDPVLDIIGRDTFSDLTPQDRMTIRAFMVAFFRQAAELIENPGRPAGWSFEDPVILNSIGQGSKVIVQAMANLAATEPELADRLSRPARFLDVGTGVGWIAIEAARRWPALSVDGIDIFPPALTIAAQNLIGSGVADRVAFQAQDVLDLHSTNRHALAFFAGPFISAQIVPQALINLYRTLEPGGWLCFGLFDADPAPLSQALLNLRIARFGGHPWAVAEVADMMTSAGFSVNPQTVLERPARLVVGRKT